MRKGFESRTKQLASEILKEVKYNPTHDLRPVPLLEMAKILDIGIVRLPREYSFGADGALWKVDKIQPSLFGDVNAQIGFAAATNQRFVLAHEIAHRISDLYLANEETADWTSLDWQRFVNDLAGRLLIPDSVFAVRSKDHPLGLTLHSLSAMRRNFHVTYSCLIGRLNQAEREGIISLSNCAIVVNAGVSSVQRTNYGPRVLSCCTPRQWYIPTNKRLSSLNLIHLSRTYWNAEVLTRGAVEDEINLWNSRIRGTVSYRVVFDYMVFKSNATGGRVLISTFCSPPLS